MANFKTHIAFGVISGLAAAAAGFYLHFLNVIQAVTAFSITMLASGVPDIDSDHARPTEILFGILGIVFPVLLYQRLDQEKLQSEEVFCLLLFSYVAIQHGLSWIFSRFTVHRGIFHSIPAAMIMGEVVYLLFHQTAFGVRLYLGVCATAGYLAHLVLDEIFSVDVLGVRLKKSSGTALCLLSQNPWSTAVAYLILIGLTFYIGLESGLLQQLRRNW